MYMCKNIYYHYYTVLNVYMRNKREKSKIAPIVYLSIAQQRRYEVLDVDLALALATDDRLDAEDPVGAARYRNLARERHQFQYLLQVVVHVLGRDRRRAVERFDYFRVLGNFYLSVALKRDVK